MAYHCPRCKQTRKPIHITVAKRLRPTDTAKTVVGPILRRCNVRQTRLTRQPTNPPTTCVSTNPNAIGSDPTHPWSVRSHHGFATLMTNRIP